MCPPWGTTCLEGRPGLWHFDIGFIDNFLTTSMASVEKPKSYMIHNILSWSVELNAEVKSMMSAYMSFLESLASSRAI